MTQKSHHILIVDDARGIREPLGQYLRKQGFRTSLAENAIEARQLIEQAGIDLAILDIMMPGEDGLSLCRWMVANTNIPVIMLTAMADETDRIVGLELGADDYVVKPFNPRELLARIKAVLRRMPERQYQSDNNSFAGWTHQGARKWLNHVDGREVSLTTSENRLLAVFLQNPNTVLSRARLLDITAGREEKAFDRTIDNQIGRLRKKIEDDPKAPKLLITERGGGYVLAVETVVPC
ncbi:response regulator transcription factor [Octadecabacter sp. CECT 8868]|uniref:response regulator n=1 Tax=Octadecabacter algicola TaxID=2909342 RepID=UPI001F1F196C|nr:response regulator transcription factor [Octadecabacter algicola]MCF2904256.1 response regulator transcription factor [Octadecabacter algicola]